MEPISHSAIRKFAAEEHIRHVLDGPWIELLTEAGTSLAGIHGRAGAAALSAEGVEIGADLIEMQPDSMFPLHTHPGEHILYIIKGEGLVHVDGVDHRVRMGDTIFIPAEYAHGVRTVPMAVTPLVLLAVGYPHKHLGSHDRMHIVSV